jgi:PAS domain S-box-containing protein
VMFYTSVIAVSFRFGINTTLFTASLYTAGYFALLVILDQLEDNLALATVRTGFIFIIGFLTHLITKETLLQTQQKLLMKRLAEEAQENEQRLKTSQEALSNLNNELQLRNDIFKHAEENAKIGSYAWDLTTNKLSYSDNLFRMLGFKAQEFTPTFEKFLDFVHPEDKDKLITDVKAAQETNSQSAIHYRIITKAGEVKHIRSTATTIVKGDTKMMIGTSQDVTEDVRLNEKVQFKNQELERSNKELESFNYIASHDLQEPVRKIHTFSSLVLEKEKANLTPTGIDYLSRISSSAKRMQGLIEAFLDYSRIENTPIRFERTDLNKIVSEVKQTLADVIQEAKAVVECETLPVVEGVPIQLQQLFINLISNAIKYQRKGVTPHIKISAEQIAGEKIEKLGASPKMQYYKIMVSDNGIGFEQQYANKIFEVFQRLHSKDQYAGTGIGLAICKKIVVTHKGFINAYGKIDLGAVFNIYLPVQ